MENQIRVSVVIPCWQNNNTIRDAVDSVLEQTEKSLEILIIDGGNSLDRSLLPRDGRVRIIESPERRRAGAARRLGVEHSLGEYVAFLDADDMWAPDKLEKELTLITRKNRQGENPLLVYTGRLLIREDGTSTGRYLPARKIVRYRDILFTNHISCSSVLMKRKTAEELIYPAEGVHEDYAAWLDLLQKGGYAVGISRPLLLYRVRRDSQSGRKKDSARMHWRTLRFHGLSGGRAMLYMVSYAWFGLKKYYFPIRRNNGRYKS